MFFLVLYIGALNSSVFLSDGDLWRNEMNRREDPETGLLPKDWSAACCDLLNKEHDAGFALYYEESDHEFSPNIANVLKKTDSFKKYAHVTKGL